MQGLLSICPKFEPLHPLVTFHRWLSSKGEVTFFRNEVTWIELQEKASEYTILHCTDRVTHGLDLQEYHQIFILPIFQNHQFNANWDTSDKARKCVDFFFSCDVMTFTLGPLLMFIFHGDSNFTQRNQPLPKTRFWVDPTIVWLFVRCKQVEKAYHYNKSTTLPLPVPKQSPQIFFWVIDSIKLICKHNV